MSEPHRCPWAESSEAMRAYHDTEWGVPLKDDQKLFELLILEGFQAGLSWETVLQKRANFRAAFDGFAPEKIIHYEETKLADLLSNPGIIRNRLKVRATLDNARAYLQMQQAGESFGDFLWSFVDHQPLINHPTRMADIPAQTDRSVAMSKALKQRGFRFVGPTICYAFMQSAGLVNDHLTTCRFRV